MKLFPSLIASVFLLSACATNTATPAPIVTPTVIPETHATAIIATPTAAATETGTPTPEATATPTPTEATKIDEHDLNPAFTETVHKEFMGVTIDAQLITDESATPDIKKVSVPPNTYAEFVARTFFKVWWYKGTNTQTGSPTEDGFKSFMAMWAKAQKSGDPKDWADVEMNIYDDRLRRFTKIRPMFSGQDSEGMIGISSLAVAIVDQNKINSMSTIPEGTDIQKFAEYNGYRTYIHNNTLNVLSAFYPGYTAKTNVASGMAVLHNWIVKNTGVPLSNYLSEDKALERILINGGITVSN